MGELRIDKMTGWYILSLSSSRFSDRFQLIYQIISDQSLSTIGSSWLISAFEAMGEEAAQLIINAFVASWQKVCLSQFLKKGDGSK